MGYFFPSPRKGKLGRRRVQRADTRPSGLVLAPEFRRQFWNGFQMVPLAIGIDTSGVPNVDFCSRQSSAALFLPFRGVGEKQPSSSSLLFWGLPLRERRVQEAVPRPL